MGGLPPTQPPPTPARPLMVPLAAGSCMDRRTDRRTPTWACPDPSHSLFWSPGPLVHASETFTSS